MRKFLASVAIVFTMSGAAQAQETPREIIAECFQAISGENENAAREAARKLIDFGVITETKDRVDASYCLREVTKESWSYSESLNRMVVSRLKATLFALQSVEEDAIAAYTDLNEATVAVAIQDACMELHSRDWVLAMTSEICAMSFKRNKHPSMPSRETFVAEALEAELSSMSEADKQLVREFFSAASK